MMEVALEALINKEITISLLVLQPSQSFEEDLNSEAELVTLLE